MNTNINKNSLARHNFGTETWVLSTLLLYTGFFFFYQLGHFPAIHADETKSIYRGIQLLESGKNPLYGQNDYTGSFFYLYLGAIVEFFSMKLKYFRLLGVLLNFLVIIWLTAILKKRLGGWNALLFLFLTNACLQTLYSRFAWEVMALNWFFGALALGGMVAWIESEKKSILGLVLFFTGSFWGVMNHYIFIALTIAVFLALALLLTHSRDKKFQQIWIGCAIHGISLIIFYIFKGSWNHMGSTAYAWVIFLWAMSVGVGVYSQKLRVAFPMWVHQKFLTWIILGIIGALSLRFIWFHAHGLLGVLNGELILRRIFSYDSPLPIQILLYSYSAVLLALYGWALFHELRRRDAEFWKLFILLLPICYVGYFGFLVTKTSLRYYNVLGLIIPFSICILPWSLKWLRGFVLAAGIYFISMHGWFWSERINPPLRTPVYFSVGLYRKETSFHFVDVRLLYQKLKEKGICRYRGRKDDLLQFTVFLEGPLSFYRDADGFKCTSKQVAHVTYCPECREPPYFLKILKIE